MQAISAPSNLIKTGTLRLAGTAANTYGGSTTVELGTQEQAKPDNVATTPSTLAPGSAAGNVLTTGAAALYFGPSARLQINLPSAIPGTHRWQTVNDAFRPGDSGGGSLYVNPSNNPTRCH